MYQWHLGVSSSRNPAHAAAARESRRESQAAVDSCCAGTVGTAQLQSTETFAFRIITPGCEELTQMVSKFARKQYYNTQFESSFSH